MMQPFQTSYTVYYNKRHGRTGHVFEQRYRALLVDKDNYLVAASRYIHLNPVGAGIVKRPQDYRWGSYGTYVNRKGMFGVKCETVLNYFSGTSRGQLTQYREFVEGELRRKENKWTEPPVLKQAFIGDEDFVERVRKKARKLSVKEGHYPLKRIVQAVCQVPMSNYVCHLRGKYAKSETDLAIPIKVR